MPSSIDKLRNILKLETERKYDNRAVVGGLDKFLPSWKNDATGSNLSERLIEIVSEKISRYDDATVQERAEIISSILAVLDQEDANGKSSVPKKPAAKPAAEERFHSQNSKSTGVAWPKPKNPPFQPKEAPGNIGINAPLTVIPGIGPGHARTLANLGLDNLGDLLYYFPRRYDDYSKLKQISKVSYGEELTLLGTIEYISSRPFRSGNQKITEAVLSDGTGSIRLTWFNRAWIENQLKPGQQIVVAGKIDIYLGRFVINNPEWEHVEQEHLVTNRIVPVYPLTARITQKWLRKIMFQTVTFWSPRLTDFLPQKVRDSAGLTGLPDAILQIHFPDNVEKLKSARERLSFDEIFCLQLGVLKQKFSWQSVSAAQFTVPDEWVENILQNLPFQLTPAQIRTLNDVRNDLASGKPMNRLIQGDVGSGKTIIAALAAWIVTQSGSQAAFMAPTSILAEQHYRNLTNLVKSLSAGSGWLQPEQIRLLIGSTPGEEKQQIITGLENGDIKLVIGTHALIEDPIQFKHLQLAIVDEQHRFGVSQRAVLRSKGSNPHLLVMTATPIPRSLALTVYGDLDLSVIDELPEGRQPVETHVLHPLERERAYQLIRNQVSQGYQVFITYPLIEQGENGESKAAVEEHRRLQTEVFPNLKLGLLHGRMRPEEKDEAMTQFRSGEFHILVSTSVVEVGVDVPNATVMLVEGANRFGLAQLHQFRGRVGRGQAKAYCLLIPENEDALENERLAAMAETNDGFILAERDLEQRGPGEFLGTRQSGYTELKMANLMDVRLIEKARKHAQALFQEDPELTKPEHRELEKMMLRFWNSGKGDIS